MPASESVMPIAGDVRHETFTLQRTLAAAPHTVYDAFRLDQIRRRWFRMPGSDAVYEHDFSVGAGELARSTFSVLGSEPESLEYRSRYLDLVENERIVFVYESSVNQVRRWVSLVTVTLTGQTSTDLIWTEQVAFLVRTGDGSADLPHLRGGTSMRLNGLGAALSL